MEFKHKSVLLEETIEGLRVKPDGIYVDGTLGLSLIHIWMKSTRLITMTAMMKKNISAGGQQPGKERRKNVNLRAGSLRF